MEFYLNQKSMPIVRRCLNCRFYKQELQSCGVIRVSSAYNHEKLMHIKVSDNFYCEKHKFINENELSKSAVKIELDDVQSAMDLINQRKQFNDDKRRQYPLDDY
jgi:type III secretory pathway component EscU